MIKEVEAKSILLTNKDDSWFNIKYYMNIYRGCMHGCIYCDSRSDCYNVDKFDQTIYVKKNAIELLREELSKKRKKGIIGFGSMSDAYIPIEKEYKMTRRAIEVINEFKYPLLILTKSNLVLRDLDLLMEINKENYACVTFTITTFSDTLAKIIEPNASLPSERFKAMKILQEAGIKVGVMMAPILPFILDSEENIKRTIELAKESGASFIVPCFGMTLRGSQRDYYYSELIKHFPSLKNKYIKTYGDNYFCPINNLDKIKKLFYAYSKELGISTSMPKYNIDQTSCAQLSIFDII